MKTRDIFDKELDKKLDEFFENFLASEQYLENTGEKTAGRSSKVKLKIDKRGVVFRVIRGGKFFEGK